MREIRFVDRIFIKTSNRIFAVISLNYFFFVIGTNNLTGKLQIIQVFQYFYSDLDSITLSKLVQKRFVNNSNRTWHREQIRVHSYTNENLSAILELSNWLKSKFHIDSHSRMSRSIIIRCFEGWKICFLQIWWPRLKFNFYLYWTF